MDTFKPDSLKIAVMGAGAVGCYFGGMLARAGHSVTLIGRPLHVDAIQRDGLLLDTQSFSERVAVQASTEAAKIAGARLVLFCVKSTDTAHVATDMLPYLDPAATVLSLQNGVDNAVVLQSVLPQSVIPAVVYVATQMAGPGHVRHFGRGELVIGEAAASTQIAAQFGAAGVPVEVSDNVAGALWAKLIVNCAYNALSAITQMPYGRLAQGEGVQQMMRDVVQECLSVAAASGVIVPGDSLQDVARIAQTMSGQISSTAQDLARGKRSEIDHLNGYVVRQAQLMGIAAPVNHALHTLVKLLECR
jgi:2-dehydropantoate 2-reductase